MPPNYALGLNVYVKISILGSATVGKTSIALRLCRGPITEKPKTTVALDWLRTSIQIGDRKVNLQIWDTAGQERFSSVLPNFIRGSAAIILVYDVTNVKSFSSITYWLNVARTEVPEAIIVLVANKVDEGFRAVSQKEGEDYARNKGITYVETSASSGHNVEKLFHDLAERVMAQPLRTPPVSPQRIVLQEVPKRKCQC